MFINAFAPLSHCNSYKTYYCRTYYTCCMLYASHNNVNTFFFFFLIFIRDYNQDENTLLFQHNPLTTPYQPNSTSYFKSSERASYGRCAPHSLIILYLMCISFVIRTLVRHLIIYYSEHALLCSFVYYCILQINKNFHDGRRVGTIWAFRAERNNNAS